MLGLESERKLLGHGVSTCATCDGYFFRGKAVVVVGGGDTAAEDALFLTRYATEVSIDPSPRSTSRLQDHAGPVLKRKNQARWNSVVTDVLDVDKGEVTGVQLERRRDRRRDREAHARRLHRHRPHAEHRPVSGQLEMNEKGYLMTHDGSKTNVPGVFAAGDVQDHIYRQAITAAGSGCMAAIDAERFLEAKKSRVQS